MAYALLDTGVWYALCDSRDLTAPRESVEALYAKLEPHDIILPWPVAYETLRTRFVRNRLALNRFEREMKSSRIIMLEDERYRDNAYQLVFDSARRGRPLSFVDCLLRLLIEDINVKLNYVVTFNERDFVDVCRARQIELWRN